MISHRFPSVQTGYARGPGESEYPSLWRGLYIAIVPGLHTYGDIVLNMASKSQLGTLVNSPVYAPGKYSRTLEFNGTDNYISLGAAWKNYGGPITWAFWNWGASGNANGHGGFGNDNGDDRLSCHAPFSDSVFYFDYGDLAGNVGRISTDYSAYEDQWAHVALQSDGISGTNKRIYINASVAVSQGTGSDGPSGDVTLDIGRANVAATIRYHEGQIDENYMYRRILTAAEIETLYCVPYAPFVKRRRIYAFSPAAGGSIFPPNSLALTGVGR